MDRPSSVPQGPVRLLAVVGVALLVLAGAARAQVQAVVRASTSSAGEQGNASSSSPSISADGRYVAFDSLASNLVPGDTNDKSDVFVKDLETGELVRVSTGSAGEQGNDSSGSARISADGRYVAFDSLAGNLVPGDTNGKRDVFVKDLETGELVRVSTGSAGEQGNDSSGSASISADGRYVAFDSWAGNLVPGDTNDRRDVFVKELETGVLVRVSTGSAGEQGNTSSSSPSISADGRYVAFSSLATNLVPGDTNDKSDVFVKDLETGELVRVSTGSAGEQGNDSSGSASISADGRYVAFDSLARNLVPGGTHFGWDVFVKDLETGELVRASTGSAGEQGNDSSGLARISADGRYVAFQSFASNLVPGDTNGKTDVFVKELETGALVRASTNGVGEQGNNPSYQGSLSADGRYVAFQSFASNLVPGDTNGRSDVFVTLLDFHPDVAAPQNLRAESERTGVRLTWTDASDNETGFRVLRRRVGQDGYQVLATLPAGTESYLDTTARGGVLYGYVVHALRDATTSLPSNEARIWFLPPVNAPQNLQAESELTGVRLTWTDASDNETGFRVQRRVGQGEFSNLATLPAGTESYLDTTAQEGVTYGYVVLALGQYASSRSNEATITYRPMRAPRQLAAVAVSSYRVEVTWQDVSGEDGYEVWAAVDGGEPALVGTRGRNATYFRHVLDGESHTVDYFCRTLHRTGASEFAGPVTAYVLAQPRGLNARALNSRLLRITWQDRADNEAGYEVWRALGEGEWTLLRRCAPNTVQYTDRVEPNAEYRYRVRAWRGPHVSSPTNTDRAPSMLPPTEVRAVALEGGGVEVGWRDNSEGLATEIHVLRRPGWASGVKFKVAGVASSGEASWRDGEATPGTVYVYRVRAARGNDWSDESPSVKARAR